MSDLIQSYRSMSLGKQVLWSGGVVLAAIILIGFVLPHVLGFVVGAAFAFAGLAVAVLIVAACVVGVIALVRALGTQA
ncbi:MAG: hypothetical protein ACREQM_12530 [Candidatus Dormibacteraceae bacterium]